MEENNRLNLTAIKATPKIGNEHLTFNEKSVGYSLLEFWQWSVSDILSNATRGRFAEFIVGTAVEMNPKRLRDEWDAFDIKTDNGIKIEIKSASYIQSWNQKNFSAISFSIRKVRYWDPNAGMSGDEAKRHADLYVFCLLKIRDQKMIDPLKLEQWEFYVLPTYKLDNYTRSQTSITLNSLQKLTESVNYDELKSIIEKCYAEECEYQKKVY
ncbi:hypothetical protein [uncultured Proteiniphilum sp.]|uniref:hypothetical protein n=1 Tax=uncultured Proteiniphilum sp. TaxID=497637 RepID=UPI00260D8FEB|nr:hypothetical protein [uncultured Proteiniphilum sp.]